MQRLLIVGYGDIAGRVAAILPPAVETRTLSRRHGTDLDHPEAIPPLAGWADTVLHTAPPRPDAETDTRTANLLRLLEGGKPRRMVYLGTSGVYGDCGGERVDETRPPNPMTPRARRRLDAERRIQEWCRLHDVAAVILRVPGIYDSHERLPLARLRAGTPALRAEDDGYTNHVHADDLAAIALRACADDAPPGVYNASDDSELKMGEWFDLVADRHGLPRPPRIARAEAPGRLSPELLSFMGESRRLVNAKMKRQLGVRLRYPTVFDGVPPRKAAA